MTKYLVIFYNPDSDSEVTWDALEKAKLFSSKQKALDYLYDRYCEKLVNDWASDSEIRNKWDNDFVEYYTEYTMEKNEKWGYYAIMEYKEN